MSGEKGAKRVMWAQFAEGAERVRSGVEQRVATNKGDKEGEKVDAVASGMLL